MLGPPVPHPHYKRAGRREPGRAGCSPRSPTASPGSTCCTAIFRFIPSTIAFVLRGRLVGRRARRPHLPALGLVDPARAGQPATCPSCSAWATPTRTRIVFYLALGFFFAGTLFPVLRGAALLEALFARALLSGVNELREQVAEAEAARDTAQAQKAAAVSAEATALRRLERDIHDGPQQRLVRLAMDLGRAEQQFGTDPEAARATVAEALSQTRETLDELRALSRGIAPPILVDRGLQAALTALAGRCTIPVDLDAPPMDRLDPAVETTAYFVVAEALTNVAKHSHAGEVQVSVRREPTGLLITVADDGVGGASLAKGHGLAGLADRVEAAGGVLAWTARPAAARALTVALPPVEALTAHRLVGMRVVIADDAVLLREGLVRLVEENGHTVVAAVGDGPSLVEAIVEHQPGRVHRGRPDAADAHRRGSAGGGRGPRPGAGQPDPGALPVRRGRVRRRPARRPRWARSATCSRTGSPRSPSSWTALRRVADGGTVLDPEVVGQLLVRRRRDDPLRNLTPREREVLGLMAEGLSNTAIARKMVVTEGAVEKHVRNIFTKLDLPPDEEQHRRVLAVLAYLQG